MRTEAEAFEARVYERSMAATADSDKVDATAVASKCAANNGEVNVELEEGETRFEDETAAEEKPGMKRSRNDVENGAETTEVERKKQIVSNGSDGDIKTIERNSSFRKRLPSERNPRQPMETYKTAKKAHKYLETSRRRQYDDDSSRQHRLLDQRVHQELDKRGRPTYDYNSRRVNYHHPSRAGNGDDVRDEDRNSRELASYNDNEYDDSIRRNGYVSDKDPRIAREIETQRETRAEWGVRSADRTPMHADDDNRRAHYQPSSAKSKSYAPASDTPGFYILYKSAICRFWKRGQCPKGPLCAYAHGEHEVRNVPYRDGYYATDTGGEARLDPQLPPRESERHESPLRSAPLSPIESQRNESRTSEMPVQISDAPAPRHSEAEPAETIEDRDPNEILYVPMTREVYEYIQKLLLERPRMVVDELKISTAEPPSTTRSADKTEERPGDAFRKSERLEPGAPSGVANPCQSHVKMASHAAKANVATKKLESRSDRTKADRTGGIGADSTTTEKWKQKIPCRYYARNGNCRNGDKCPFSHIMNRKSDGDRRVRLKAEKHIPLALAETKKSSADDKRPLCPPACSGDGPGGGRTVSYKRSLGPCPELFLKGCCLDTQCRYSHEEPTPAELNALFKSSKEWS